MIDSLKVMYDGWALGYAPGSPAELHLMALLSNLPPQVQALVALPAEPVDQLPPGVESILHATPNTYPHHLAWEQSSLPRLARQAEAALLHLPQSSAPLFARIPVVAEAANSGIQTPGDGPVGLWHSLSTAFGLGGLSRQKLLLWPLDLPIAVPSEQLALLPPLVHPAFKSAGPAELADLQLPETYILYHGWLEVKHCVQVLETWSWAANSIGANFPLLLAGADPGQLPQLEKLIVESGLGSSVRLLPPLKITALAALYRHCTAFFYPLPADGWGDPLRHALSCSVPVAACADPLSASLVGPAAYLAPVGNARLLGAGLLSLIVEESLGEKLAAAAGERSAAWNSVDFGPRLWEIYQQVIHPAGV